MNQLDKRLTQLEDTERTRVLTEMDALFEGMTDTELEELGGPHLTDEARALSGMSDEDFAAADELYRRTAPFSELQSGLTELRQWLAAHRAQCKVL